MFSPIQLRRHVFTTIELVALPLKGQQDEESYSFDLKFGDPKKKDGEWHGALELQFAPDKKGGARYQGRLAVRGEFVVHPDFDSAKEEALVRFNSGSLLLSAIREMLLMLTSRCAGGPMEIPTFNPQMFLQTGSQPEAPVKGPAKKKRARATR